MAENSPISVSTIGRLSCTLSSTVGKTLTESIINAFRHFYTPRTIRISYDEYEYEDEDTTYEYDETDWDKPPVKRLNK